MKRVLMLAALTALGAGTAHAAGPFQNINVGLEGTSLQGDLEYTGGKPNEPLEGGGLNVSFGANAQVGGLVFGLDVRKSLNEVQAQSQRDGNYLVQGGTLKELTSAELRAGWAFGKVLPYAAVGVMQRDLSIFQSCPDDPAATVAGFCYGGGVPATQQARKGKTTGIDTSTATVYRIGVEYAIEDRWSVGLSAYDADFGETVVKYGNSAIPATNPNQDVRGVALTVKWNIMPPSRMGS